MNRYDTLVFAIIATGCVTGGADDLGATGAADEQGNADYSCEVRDLRVAPSSTLGVGGSVTADFPAANSAHVWRFDVKASARVSVVATTVNTGTNTAAGSPEIAFYGRVSSRGVPCAPITNRVRSTEVSDLTTKLVKDGFTYGGTYAVRVAGVTGGGQYSLQLNCVDARGLPLAPQQCFRTCSRTGTDSCISDESDASRCFSADENGDGGVCLAAETNGAIANPAVCRYAGEGAISEACGVGYFCRYNQDDNAAAVSCGTAGHCAPRPATCPSVDSTTRLNTCAGSDRQFFSTCQARQAGYDTY